MVLNSYRHKKKERINQTGGTNENAKAGAVIDGG